MSALTAPEKEIFLEFIRQMQIRLCERLENIDQTANFAFKSWERPNGGGGTMGVLRGQAIEKSGVNISEVWGDHFPNGQGEGVAGKKFWATGLSTVTHPLNPYAPIGHMNVRLIEVGEGFWFGGGADLTPFLKDKDDEEAFHQILRTACESLDQQAYAKYSKWCDEYFYIKHRARTRGIGGIFFDHLKGSFAQNFPFIQKVVHAFIEIYPTLVQKHIHKEFTPKQKYEHELWRGHYVEFNLIYDRGTHFGLSTGGNVEAILVSLPPVARW